MTDRLTEHDRIVEGSLREWLAVERPLPPDRDAELQTILEHIHEAPGARRRLQRWLGRDALARRRRERRDLHSRTELRRDRLMYSTTGLVALIAALALAVNVITDSNGQPSAAGAATLSVAADGSADHSTIGDALEAAADGDTILVAPGTYQEALLIDKDVTIRGDGPREEVVITGHADPAMWPAHGERTCVAEGIDPGCAVLVVGASPTIADLTFQRDFAGVYARSGSPVLERLVFDGVGRVYLAKGEPAGETVAILGGAHLTLRDSELRGGRGVDIREKSSALIEDNEFTGGAVIVAASIDDDVIIRGNLIADALETAVEVSGPTHALIEDNVITGAVSNAIAIGWTQGDSSRRGIEPVIRGNRIEASDHIGILVKPYTDPVITGNVMAGNPTGIQIGNSAAIVSGNEITDGKVGIVVVSRGTPTITDNVIDVSGRGIVAGKGTSPAITGNDVCGGDVSLYVSDEATPELGENQTCEGGVTG